MKFKYDKSIAIEDYELLDKEKNTKNRCGFHWTLHEDFMLTENYGLFNKDIYKIAISHKRSFKAICFRLELNGIVSKKFNREWIEMNNQVFLKSHQDYVYK